VILQCLITVVRFRPLVVVAWLPQCFVSPHDFGDMFMVTATTKIGFQVNNRFLTARIGRAGTVDGPLCSGKPREHTNLMSEGESWGFHVKSVKKPVLTQAVNSSEKPVSFYQSTQCYIPEDNHLYALGGTHTYRCSIQSWSSVGNTPDIALQRL
jgi:hypothetical protein